MLSIHIINVMIKTYRNIITRHQVGFQINNVRSVQTKQLSLQELQDKNMLENRNTIYNKEVTDQLSSRLWASL